MKEVSKSALNHVKSYFFKVSLIALILLLVQCKKDDEPLVELGEVTDEVIMLGNPLLEQYKDDTPRVYARNIWDMHAFGSKIYLGAGNSSNVGPAPNSGRAVLWSYDIATQAFVKEFTVDEEQIHLIREFDNQLYIPGHDSRESWDLGNFYRLESSEWKKYRTIPDGIHVYDIYKWKNRLFAAIGPQGSTKAIQVSEDDGQTWKDAINSGGRIYNLFLMSNKLWTSGYSLMSYSDSSNTFLRPTPSSDMKLYGTGRMERTVVFDGQTVFINGKADNDHQYLPVDLRSAIDVYNVNLLNLPEGALPRDILVKGKRLLVLTSVKINDNLYRNAVLGATSLAALPVEWVELFHFTAGSFVRSFEYLNGAFYFGLGCETDLLLPATGNILSFKYSL